MNTEEKANAASGYVNAMAPVVLESHHCETINPVLSRFVFSVFLHVDRFFIFHNRERPLHLFIQADTQAKVDGKPHHVLLSLYSNYGINVVIMVAIL